MVFTDLVAYMCLGCSPNQPKYVNEKDKTITLCNTMAERVWSNEEKAGENLKNEDLHPAIYDSCGLKVNGTVKI